MFTILESVALVCLTIIGFQLLFALYKILYYNIFASLFHKNVNLKDAGQWAVVTGATDGIGRAFAEELAKQGLDVILISRTMAKLEAVAAEIEKIYGVSTKVIEADFTNDSLEMYHQIEKELTVMDIGILINNVGMSYSFPEYFLDVPNGSSFFTDIIKCNIISVTNMTRIVLPKMVEKRKGIIINISSTASVIPSPLLTVYGASKAYVEKFSRDLNSEYARRGIIVQCLLPGYVATKLSKIRQTTWMAPSPKHFVKSALKTTGVQTVTTGYFPHSLLVSFIKLIQNISPKFAVYLTKNTMENIRRRALRRIQN